jgi:hypothetical protein
MLTDGQTRHSISIYAHFVQGILKIEAAYSSESLVPICEEAACA